MSAHDIWLEPNSDDTFRPSRRSRANVGAERLQIHTPELNAPRLFELDPLLVVKFSVVTPDGSVALHYHPGWRGFCVESGLRFAIFAAEVGILHHTARALSRNSRISKEAAAGIKAVMNRVVDPGQHISHILYYLSCTQRFPREGYYYDDVDRPEVVITGQLHSHDLNPPDRVP